MGFETFALEMERRVGYVPDMSDMNDSCDTGQRLGSCEALV